MGGPAARSGLPASGWIAAGAAALALSAAGGCGDPPAPFEVAGVSPDPASGPLKLNQPIEVRFSANVDPSSVSASSVRVEAAGRTVGGSFRVRGARVAFLPDPIRKDGGGYVPGSEVTLFLEGFPSRLGVRSSDGRPLSRAFSARFRTAEPEQGRPDLAYVDVRPGEAPRVVGVEDTSRGALLVRFSEPLLPASVDSSSIQIRFDDRDRTPVPSQVELVQGLDAAEVLVRPVDGFAPGTAYLLVIASGPCDLGGRPMEGVLSIRFQMDARSGRLVIDRPGKATGPE